MLNHNVKFKAVNKKVSRAEDILNDNKKWIVWWYCGFYKSTTKNSQPDVLVEFRELSGDNNISSDSITFKKIPVTLLSYFRIGTVWIGSTLESVIVFETQEFDINFSLKERGWLLQSFQSNLRIGAIPPFPISIYDLKYKEDVNWLLSFSLQNGGRLIVPCMEFFLRCYGKSMELKRILTTYPWDGVKGAEDRLYAPLSIPEDPNYWIVCLRNRLILGDRIILAHAKYNKSVKNILKGIYSQLETQYKTDSKVPIFLKIMPWIQEGVSTIRVQGIKFEDNSFLALRVVSYLEPKTDKELLYDIEPKKEKHTSDNEKPNDNGAIANTTTYSLDDNGSLTIATDQPPGHSDLSIDIADLFDETMEGVINQGIRANLTSHTQGIGSGYSSMTSPTNTSSTDAPYGSGNVGFASIASLESHGALRDVWNAVKYLHIQYPKIIISVEWFTFESNFQSSNVEPKLISLNPFTEEEIRCLSEKTDPHWFYFNPKQEVLRGVLVIKLIVNNIVIYLIEVQRRFYETSNKEESLTGFVFRLRDESLLRGWLEDYLSNIRIVNGVSDKLTSKCPGVAASFSHRKAKGERVASEAAVLNALKKMDIDVSSLLPVRNPK